MPRIVCLAWWGLCILKIMRGQPTVVNTGTSEEEEHEVLMLKCYVNY